MSLAAYRNNTTADGQVIDQFEVHECTITKHNVNISVTLQPFLDQGTLVYRIAFTVKGFDMGKLSAALESFGKKIFIVCPHDSLQGYCMKMMDDATDSNEIKCKDCDIQVLQYNLQPDSNPTKGRLCFTVDRPLIGPLQGELRDSGWNKEYIQAWVSRSNLTTDPSLDIDEPWDSDDECEACH